MNEGESGADERAAFDRLLAEQRPRLHRYCARMTGSVIDGEDAVQEALVKAIEAFPSFVTVANPEAWLFRIAHNATLDLLRRRARQNARHAEKELDMIVDPVSAVADRQSAAVSLRTFMRLPLAQRSSVILMDVLGYSLNEVAGVTATTVPSIKAALHRGRSRLREFSQEPEDRPAPALSAVERARLTRYIDHFNAREFDTLRNLLADEVRLDLVNRRRLEGRSQVSSYFTNYDRSTHWHFVPGLVEGRPAILVHEPGNPGAFNYFVLLGWQNDSLVTIRDFLYAPYVMEGADFMPLG
ncbi:MAG TPA: sigma-70 family RNA polymerase sigma factor [Stellaceae bacterium]|nr:sigma-70 family RNA polymerase sigma factor [Stellaceae bacterium]